MRALVFTFLIVFGLGETAAAVTREEHRRALSQVLPTQVLCERRLTRPTFPPAPDRILIQRTHLIITLDQTVFWKGRPLYYTDYRFPSGAAWRLLLRLTDPEIGDKDTVTALVQDVWKGVSSTDTGYHLMIPRYVNGLRRCFRKVDPAFDAIETIKNKGGYRWVDPAI